MQMKRDLTPDVLRGFALLGILVVNIQFMARGAGALDNEAQDLANGSATFIIATIFTGKFYLIFSFLFGYSSNYVIKGDRSNRARWVKRCLALMVLGVLHISYSWHGDILFMYGILGLLLIPFFFRADKTVKIWAYAVFLVTSAILLFEPIALNVLQGGFAFAAFLLGLRMARTQFLTSPIDVNQNSKSIKRGLFLGAPIQIVAALALVQNEQSGDPSEAVYQFALAVSFIAAPLLSMFFVGVIRKLVEEKPNSVSWMKPAGQMSLTVYISQSVITSLIFGPWGLGLFQDLQTWQVLILAFGIWGLLVYLSTIWLKKYKQGPLEKLVHSVTKDR
jgi:uncharacterized protein